MTSAYSKSYRYKKFSVHTNTKKCRFQIVPFWKAFSKVPFSWIFLCGYKRISVDGRRIRNNKAAFSDLSGIVRTGPENQLFGYIRYCTEIPEININLLPNTCNFHHKCWLIFSSHLSENGQNVHFREAQFQVFPGACPRTH